MIHIGNDLRAETEKKGVTKKELARQLGLSEVQVYRIFNSEHIRTDLLLRFCEILEVYPSRFFKNFTLPYPDEVEATRLEGVREGRGKHQTTGGTTAYSAYGKPNFKVLYEQSLETIAALKDHNETLKKLSISPKK
jgi:DNA-binding Xre family transcriptional regulator